MPLTEQQKADLAKKRGLASAKISDPNKKKAFVAKQGDTEAKGDLDENKAKRMDREADDTIATEGENIASGVRSYQKGTKFVPKTGPANLHEGEAVIPADKNPFSKEQIGEDTDRQMRGLPQKHGAALGDDIPAPALQDDGSDGSDGLAPGMDADPDADADQNLQQSLQQMQDEQQNINGKLDRIMEHLGLNDDMQDDEMGGESDMDDDRGFGGL